MQVTLGTARPRKAPLSHWKALHERAHAAGHAAATNTTPRAIIVGEAKAHFGPGANQIDHSKPVFFEAEGVCGFAWVELRPATHPFAKYLASIGVAKKAWNGGVSTWVSDYGQSHERKAAYASAYARVVREDEAFKSASKREPSCYADSRLD